MWDNSGLKEPVETSREVRITTGTYIFVFDNVKFTLIICLTKDLSDYIGAV